MQAFTVKSSLRVVIFIAQEYFCKKGILRKPRLQHKIDSTLKEQGFRYSANKLSWYYLPENDRSPNQETIQLDLIREKDGSIVVAIG